MGIYAGQGHEEAAENWGIVGEGAGGWCGTCGAFLSKEQKSYIFLYDLSHIPTGNDYYQTWADLGLVLNFMPTSYRRTLALPGNPRAFSRLIVE